MECHILAIALALVPQFILKRAQPISFAVARKQNIDVSGLFAFSEA